VGILSLVEVSPQGVALELRGLVRVLWKRPPQYKEPLTTVHNAPQVAVL